MVPDSRVRQARAAQIESKDLLKMTQTIYCTTCNTPVTLHADCTFACACEGPINALDGGDPIPAGWEIPGEDADSVYHELRRAVQAELDYQARA